MLFRIAPLLVLASFSLRGEETPKELGSLAETLVADRQPDFVLERQQTTTFQIVQLWEMRPAPDGASSGPYVEIRIFRYGSADAADEGLEAIRKSSNVSPIATFDGSDNASFVSVPGLGEKSYVWSSSPAGFASVRYRRVNVVVSVNTCGGRELADRFAFHVLDAIEQRLALSPEGLVEK